MKSPGKDENAWAAFKQKLHRAHSIRKSLEEHGAMSHFEAQSRSIVGCNELWSQFQMEARDKKISTTAGVKEMLKLKQAEQQLHKDNSVTGGGSTIDAIDGTALLSALKQSRFSDSDISARERRSSFGSISSGGSRRKSEFTGNVRQLRRYSSISECMGNESGRSFLPHLPTKTHDIDDYCEAIRGNTHNVLSLYALQQNNKTSSTTFAHVFRSWKEGLEQKQVERQQQDKQRNVAASTCGIPSTKERTMTLKSAMETSKLTGSDIGRQRRSSCGVGIASVDVVASPPRRSCFLDYTYNRNNAHDHNSNIQLRTKVTTDQLAQNSQPQTSNRSPTLEASQYEQDSDFNSSDDDDKSNNGCFEYYPCRSRQMALEKSMRSSAKSSNRIAPSLLVWSNVGDHDNGCYEYPRHSRGKAAEKSLRSSGTSSSSIGSSLLVEWGDDCVSSDDSD
ncbi:hypothetical protein HJC23_005587 [Cyclotella cryptica]|uniref:Uncharacterized protein n=1 Tax=Cyclotella cryptica TaxID=29204 RepID=A0ABD3PVH3_9STRA